MAGKTFRDMRSWFCQLQLESFLMPEFFKASAFESDTDHWVAGKEVVPQTDFGRPAGPLADAASAAAAMTLQSFNGLRFYDSCDLREGNLHGIITATFGTASPRLPGALEQIGRSTAHKKGNLKTSSYFPSLFLPDSLWHRARLPCPMPPVGLNVFLLHRRLY